MDLGVGGAVSRGGLAKVGPSCLHTCLRNFKMDRAREKWKLCYDALNISMQEYTYKVLQYTEHNINLYFDVAYTF